MKKILLFSFVLFFGIPLAIADLVIIVDIDDLLVGTEERQRKIFHALANEETRWAALKQVKTEHIVFFAGQSLENAGLAHLKPEITDAYRNSPWGKKFFSSEFIQYDTLKSGASDLIRVLVQVTLGKVIYVTGRWDTPEIRDATLAQLKKHGFPLHYETDAQYLRMKPNLTDDDPTFKANEIQKIIQQEGHRVQLILDDSKTNAVAMYKAATELGQQPYVIRLTRDAELPTDFSKLEDIPLKYLLQLTNFEAIIQNQQLTDFMLAVSLSCD